MRRIGVPNAKYFTPKVQPKATPAPTTVVAQPTVELGNIEVITEENTKVIQPEEPPKVELP